jgi:hypothetical protein
MVGGQEAIGRSLVNRRWWFSNCARSIPTDRRLSISPSPIDEPIAPGLLTIAY